MTADECDYWSGEGCTCEIEAGFRCKGMTKDIVPQCTLTNNDLLTEEEYEAEPKN